MAPKKLRSLAAVRKATGMSQQQLATIVGAHWITISKLERGKMRMTFEWATKLSEALKIGLDEIFHINIKDTSDLVDLSGYLYDHGRVSKLTDEDGHKISAFSNKVVQNESFYYLVDTNEFSPIIQRTDLIRLTAIPEGTSEKFLGRLCLGSIDADDYLGVSYFSSVPGKYELRSSNGSLLTPRPVVLAACVTTIVCAWHTFGELPWEEFSERSKAT